MANELTQIVAPSLGHISGRLQPVGWSAPDGSYVICLGADQDDWVVDTWPGFRLGINGVYPTGFAGGETLQIAVGIVGATQTITFLATDQTLAQVVDRINATLTDASASDVEGELKIAATARGQESRLEIVGGTGMVQLGHRAATGVGYGGLKVGDWFGFSQTINLTPVTMLTFSAKFRQPANTDIKFSLSVFFDGFQVDSIEPDAGDEIDAVTRAINASGFGGNVSVEFRIEAVPA